MENNTPVKTTNNKDIQDPITAEKIELLIQKTHNITIPSIIFEYLSSENIDFEINDLKVFYSQFGEVIDFAIKGKVSIALYKTFFSANVCREFLLNENNFKENMKKNFDVRWFNYEKDMSNLPVELEKIFENIHRKNLQNLKMYNQNNNMSKMKIAENNDTINQQNKNQVNNINTNNYITFNMMMQYNQLNVNPNMNMNNLNQNLSPINNYNRIPNMMIPPQSMNIPNYQQLFMNQNMNNLNNMNQNLNNLNNMNQNINNMNQNINNMNNMNQNMSNKNNMNQNLNNMNNVNNMNNMNGMSNLNNTNNMNNLNNMNNMSNIMNHNNNQYNINQLNSNNNNNSQNNDEKNYGKYTCKYEILIPNDKDFQVARRLIGSKGCNMKKILNECKSTNGNGNINDNVKLRLRGKGSGYKEGPQNKESDEQLHLCISSRNQEEMIKACSLVEDLLNKIFDEYKKYCIKNNITPAANQLAKRIDCGFSSHKLK